VPCSPRTRHGFVSCRWHSWGFPFRAFPSPAAVTPLDAPCPLDVSNRFRPRPPQQAASSATFPGRPPPRRCSTSESVHTMFGINRPPQPMLSWVSAPPRVSHDSRWYRLHGPFSHALSTTLHRFRKTASRPPRCPGASLSRRVACLPPPPQRRFETAVLPGVPSLVTLHILSKLPYALAQYYTTGPGVRHRLLANPLRASSRFC
jgi:hypothetical protein